MPARSTFVSVLACSLLPANFVAFLQIVALTSATIYYGFLPYVSVAQFREVPKYVACNCVILYLQIVFTE